MAGIEAHGNPTARLHCESAAFQDEEQVGLSEDQWAHLRSCERSFGCRRTAKLAR